MYSLFLNFIVICIFVLNWNFNRCNELGLIERCTKIEGRNATDDELLMKHSQDMINILKSTDDSQDIGGLETLASKYDAVYFHPVRKF